MAAVAQITSGGFQTVLRNTVFTRIDTDFMTRMSRIRKTVHERVKGTHGLSSVPFLRKTLLLAISLRRFSRKARQRAPTFP